MTTFVKMMYAVLLCCTFISCNNNGLPPSSVSQQPPYAVPPDKRNDTTLAQSGEDIFKSRCITCHGPEGSTGNMGAENLQLSIIDSPTIVDRIKNGRGKMPPFDDQFSNTQMSNLVAYIKSLRKGNK